MKPYPKYLDWLRYLSAYLLFTCGVSKLAGWQFWLSPDIARKPVGSLSGYQLTWYHYNYSHIYARILGLTQLAGGALLLFRKTALLGATAMIPMIANILMINLFFHIAVGAEFAAAFILISMLALLWRERGAIVSLFWSHQAREAAGSQRFQRIVAAVVVLVVLAQTVLLWRCGANRTRPPRAAHSFVQSNQCGQLLHSAHLDSSDFQSPFGTQSVNV